MGQPQERPESPTVTPPGMRVNTRYINFTKGTSLDSQTALSYASNMKCYARGKTSIGSTERRKAYGWYSLK